jgi:MFS family permease
MDMPIGDTTYVQPGAPVEPEIVAPAVAGGFNLKLALRYNVANLGAQVIYALFNFGMPLYLDTYKLNPSLIGLLANERSFVASFVQPLVGRMSDRTRTPLGRRRPFFLAGIPLMAVALVALATHPPFWIMLAIMSVAAFFLSVAWDPYMAFMADLFPPEHRGRVGGLLGIGSGLGTVIFLLLALNLWEHAEFAVFMMCIAVMVAAWAFTFFTVQEPPLPPAEATAPRAAWSRPHPVAYFKDVARYPEVLKYMLAVNFYWLGLGGVTPFITLFGVKALGATDQEAFLLPLIATLLNALFAVPAGYLADRYSKKAVMTVGLLIIGVVAIIGSQSQTLWQAMIALGAVGIGNATTAQINPLLADIVPRKRTAEFMGLVSAVFSFAQPLGSVAAGAVVSLATIWVGGNDAYRWAFIFAGITLLLSAVLLQTVKPAQAVLD